MPSFIHSRHMFADQFRLLELGWGQLESVAGIAVSRARVAVQSRGAGNLYFILNVSFFSKAFSPTTGQPTSKQYAACYSRSSSS